MNDAVLFNVEDNIGFITLNRPERLNAFDDATADAWARAAVAAASSEEVHAIMIKAEGRAFCAGGDVQAMSTMQKRGSEITRLAGRINEGIAALINSAKPVVAAAHGTTAGGGLGILLASDYAIVGESSKIGSLYAKIGLTPDLSVSALLARAVGERRALQLTLQNQLLTASEAKEWGLVAEVVSDDSVVDRAHQIAKGWAADAPWAIGQAKRLIRSQPERSFLEQLAEEARTIGVAAETEEANSRIMGFSAK